MTSRIEATFADPTAELLTTLARELKLSKSQVLEEAFALFQKAVLETRRGHRVAFVDRERHAVTEFATPTLARLEYSADAEWAAEGETLSLPEKAIQRILALNATPPAPSASLKKAAKARRGR